MTSVGIEYIKEAIKKTAVELPSQTNITIEELQMWINGYAACYQSVMDILESIRITKKGEYKDE